MPIQNEIREKVLAYCEAVEKQDKAAFRALFARDAALISIATLFDGIEAITERFLEGIRNAYQSIRLIPEDISVRLRDETTAVVVFRYHTECVRRDDGSDYGIAGLETQVFQRIDGDGKIIHLHYSKA